MITSISDIVKVDFPDANLHFIELNRTKSGSADTLFNSLSSIEFYYSDFKYRGGIDKDLLIKVHYFVSDKSNERYDNEFFIPSRTTYEFVNRGVYDASDAKYTQNITGVSSDFLKFYNQSRIGVKDELGGGLPQLKNMYINSTRFRIRYKSQHTDINDYFSNGILFVAGYNYDLSIRQMVVCEPENGNIFISKSSYDRFGK
jgi:hypothetical protein